MKKLAILVVLALAAAVSSASIALALTRWAAVKIPSTGNDVTLLGVSARANTDAWAVGQESVGAGQAPVTGVAYHWTGSSWSLTPTPSLGQLGALQGVSSSSPTDAWAVGFTHIRKFDDGTLIEHWNGSVWSATSVDSVTGSAADLTGVVDISPSDAWAAGQGATGGLIEHWNGTVWSVVTLPDPDFSPSPGNVISAVSANDIWLVGSTFDTATDTFVPETLNYNGTTWNVVPVAQPDETSSSLDAITAISASNVWAVGQQIGSGTAVGGSTLIEHWNGTAWSIVASPTPGADPSLSGVAGRSASDVYAVGSDLPSINGGASQSMILRWNGTSWAVDSNGAFSGSLFSAASFPGAASEWAVGIGSGDQGLVLSHS